MPPTQPYSSPEKISEIGEFGLISRISACSASIDGSVITGIGDDAAVTAMTAGMQLLTSTDMLLENVHFRREWHDPYRLGRKSLAVSISDIAAMGGIPRWSLLSLAIPADLPLGFIDEFMRGYFAMASENKVSLIGGDTCLSRCGLTVSVTIMGEQLPALIMRRSGACPGDDIWVSGTVGDAALGLKIVEEKLPLFQGEGWGGYEGDDLLSRLLDPSPRVAFALALADAGLVSTMIDISDGLLADFGHIAEQSGVGGCIRLTDLPLSAAFRTHTAHLPAIPYQLALSGGEDYELCFTAPPTNRKKITRTMKKCGIAAVPVGIVTSFPGVAVVNPDGSHYDTTTIGFNHFS